MPRFLLLLLLTVMPLSSHAIEEPDYQVVRTLDNIELRLYAPYTVAEVVLRPPPRRSVHRRYKLLWTIHGWRCSRHFANRPSEIRLCRLSFQNVCWPAFVWHLA